MDPNKIMPVKGVYPALIRYGSLLKISAQNVFSLRLQNLLTLITMSVGAFTLSATLFIGDGAMTSLWRELENLMGGWMVVIPDPGGAQNAKRLDITIFTAQELQELQANVLDVRFIEPIYSGREVFSYKNIRIQVTVDGIGDLMLKEDLFSPLKGEQFSDNALKGFSWECYLTEALYKKMDSPSLDNLYAKIGGSRFLVKGITRDPPDAHGIMRHRLIVPYSYAEQLWEKRGQYKSLVVGWGSLENAETTLTQVIATLDGIRGPGTYMFSSSAFKLRKRKDIIKSFVIFGKTQAFFCILVASISILNVMLANVVQKMKEFAIRMTLGATKTDIFIIVVAKSVFFSLFGSILGVVLSIWFSPDISKLISGYFKNAQNLTPLVSVQSIVIPIAICSTCGLLAGIAPALRAIQVDILSILRSE
jgi:ABC-type antimicrobial peptide transport system permease subunit